MTAPLGRALVCAVMAAALAIASPVWADKEILDRLPGNDSEPEAAKADTAVLKTPLLSLETSPGGTAYVRLHTPAEQDVAIRVAWSTDWASRADVNQAVPFLACPLILQGGAEGYPPGTVNELVADLGARNDLVCSIDFVRGSILVPKRNLDAAIEVANVHLRAPLFDPAWIERVRSGLAAEAAQRHADPVTAGNLALDWAMLGDTPLRRALSGGSLATIGGVSRAELIAWQKTVFRKAGTHVVVAGDLTSEEAGKAVDGLFAGLPIGKAHAAPPAVADMRPVRMLLHQSEAKSSALIFMAQLPPVRLGGEAEDLLLSAALGSQDGGVLIEALRETLRAAYATGASITGFDGHSRLFVMSAEVETSKLPEAEAAVRSAYARFRAEGPGKLFEGLRSQLIDLMPDVSDPVGMSKVIIEALAAGQEIAPMASPVDYVSKVTLDSTMARLRSVFPAPDGFLTVSVSPVATALPGACMITAPEQAVNCR